MVLVSSGHLIRPALTFALMYFLCTRYCHFALTLPVVICVFGSGFLFGIDNGEIALVVLFVYVTDCYLGFLFLHMVLSVLLLFLIVLVHLTYIAFYITDYYLAFWIRSFVW